ncbi:MAG TPA: class I SAM-dependent methyltransferase [Lachnospiraceae bacterium]
MISDNKELGVIEDTLFVPLLGRIYASEHCRAILYDKKALELKGKLPASIVRNHKQTQYTYLASASRSANMDRYIKKFLKRKPDGVIVQIGCGLETTFYRCDNGYTQWYSIDLANVIEYRRSLLPEREGEKYIAGDVFKEAWMKQIRKENPDAPLFIIASGLFYYFKEEEILRLIRMIQGNGDVEILFDAVNKRGMAMMKNYMKTVGHEDAEMFFYVDAAEELATKIGGKVRVLAEEKYYRYISKAGLKFITKVSMTVSDWFNMVKIIHLSLENKC